MAEKTTQSENQEQEPAADPEMARPLGRQMAEIGMGQYVLLGLLDGGCTLDEVIEALVMHGELPAEFERPDGADQELHLSDSSTDGWQVAS